MTVASTLIDDTLEYLGLSSYLVSADPNQQQRVLKTLQRLFYLLPEQSIYIPMNRPASTATNLREPGYATQSLIPILARYSKPFFKAAQWDSIKEDDYTSAMALLQRTTKRPRKTQYPDGLPVGQGNNDRWFNDKFFYPGETQYQVTLYDNRNKGEIKTYELDFTDEITARNTSVSSVAWSNVGAVNATISGTSLSSNVATGTLTFSAPGLAVVRVRATLADGDVYDQVLNIRVVEPESLYRDPDNG